MPGGKEAAEIENFAQTLHVEGPQLRTIEELAKSQIFLFRYCILRNSHLGTALKNELHHAGLIGVGKSILRMRGMLEDPDIARKYRAFPVVSEGQYLHCLQGCPIRLIQRWRY